MISKLVNQRVLSSHHGGAFRAGQPRVIVVHSTETPTQTGRAYQSALYVRQVGLSAHVFADPGELVAGLDESLIGWAAGNVNSAALHIEFAGYARSTRSQWLTDSGIKMLRRGAAWIADVSARRGIPLRWLTDAQLRAAYNGTGPGGLTTHDQCSRVLGGTTHWDPGPGFPTDVLLDLAKGDNMPTAKEVADELLAREVTFSDYNKDAAGEGTFETRTMPLRTLLSVLGTYSSIAANRSKQAARQTKDN